MLAQAYKLTEDERNTFEQVVKLKKMSLIKFYILKSKCHKRETVKDFATAFYESMEYFELPNQLMTERDELDLNGKNHEAEEIDQILMA